MKRLLVCLLLVGVVGCGESQSTANLTACPDCEKEVSKRATACPHCGAPLSGSQTQPPTARSSVNNIGMKMTLIPAGEFMMGRLDLADEAAKEKARGDKVIDALTPFDAYEVWKMLQQSGIGDQETPQYMIDQETDRYDDETQHLVKISKPFYLGVYEVTQQQYEKVMGARPWQGKDDAKEGADYPAVYVSHDDAVEFCRRLSKQEGAEYRLPTEAEWEYACRARTTTAYSFGDDESKLGQYAWYEKNAWDVGEKYAHRVGQKLPNRWGLYAMHGNVWEWCQDWFGPYGSEKVVRDPLGPAQGNGRVLRGGSFAPPTSSVRSASRVETRPSRRANNLGFRVVRTYNVSP
jgi:formylglycine-generating enzyme required for sulfatase activity